VIANVVDAEALIREFCTPMAVPFVPRFRLHLAEQLVPLWQATEWRAAGPQPPPFWAFAWPGSQALARYLVDAPGTVHAKRVLDFGSGSGLAAIAAASLGAASVAAYDIDPAAAAVQQLNASLNGVTFDSRCQDLVGSSPDVDVVLAGDVCYERDSAEHIIAWLRQLTNAGVDVLLADPGRHFAPSDGLELLATYDVPTLHELESVSQKRTRLWRIEQT
jgi:predicted nicotinamide N-methyase